MVGFHSALFATRDNYLRKSLKLGIIKNVINVISLMQFDIPESLNSGCKCLTLNSGFRTLDTVVDWFRTESCRTLFLILLGCESKDLMITLICRNSTGRNFYCEESNYTTGNYLRLFRKAVQSHPFSKISLLVKLQTDCSE